MLSVRYEKELPQKVPEKLAIYSLVQPKIDRADFRDLFTKLDMMDRYYSFKWEESGGCLVSFHEGFRISINQKSGALRVWTQLGKERSEYPEFTIDNESAIGIARRYVDKMELKNETSEELRLVEINHLHQQLSNIEGESTKAVKLDAGIIFGRVINEVPVSGPGGAIAIFIRGDESVSGFWKIWRKKEREKNIVKITTPDEAAIRFGRSLTQKGKKGEFIVEKVEFCYFEFGKGDAQQYLEPVYTFHYTAKSKDSDFFVKSVEVIPAGDKTYTNWHPPKRYAVKQ